jgi:hypothetical protein
MLPLVAFSEKVLALGASDHEFGGSIVLIAERRSQPHPQIRERVDQTRPKALSQFTGFSLALVAKQHIPKLSIFATGGHHLFQVVSVVGGKQ